MSIRPNEDFTLNYRGALSNTTRNRIVAFAPIAVALLGIAIMAAAGSRDGGSQLHANEQSGIDRFLTGSVVPPSIENAAD